ncbi:MAG: hypothetical protein JWP31_1815 [Aeromicrobium sp.]|nr:hypothetical protein [Aeromicrobium sp.]
MTKSDPPTTVAPTVAPLSPFRSPGRCETTVAQAHPSLRVGDSQRAPADRRPKRRPTPFPTSFKIALVRP